MSITVSIIVPVYNVEAYLEECLESIVNQTYKNLEIIIVDDCSTDDSLKICKKYQESDSRINIICNDTNIGQSQSRNKGINMAIGDWLCWVDSDDVIALNYVEVLLNTALTNNVVMVQSQLKRFTDDFHEKKHADIGFSSSKILHWRQGLIYAYSRSSCTDEYHPSSTYTRIYHRSLINKLSFDDIYYGEDSLYGPLSTFYANKIAYIDVVLYFYRQRKGSLVHSPLTLEKLSRLKAKKKLLDFWLSNNEQQLFELFFVKEYFHAIVSDYITLCIENRYDIDTYAWLKNEIYEHLNLAVRINAEDLQIYPSTSVLLRRNFNDNEGFVVYGYGENGKWYLKSMTAHNIKIIEIWDKSGDNTFINNTRFTKMHDTLNKKVYIIISIIDEFISGCVECELRELGYSNIVSARLADNVFRYLNYQKYLPKLLDCIID